MTVRDMPELDHYEVSLGRMERSAFAMRDEARNLARGVDISNWGAETPQEAVVALRDVVVRQDRVDALLDDVRALRGRARRALAQQRGEADERYDSALVQRADRRIEFEAGADRRAHAATMAVEERRAVRLLERVVDVTGEVYDAINGYHFSLSDMRRDLRAVLNHLEFQARLER